MMTKESKSRFFFWGGGGGGGDSGQGRGTGQGDGWGEIRATILISDTLYHPYTHCYKFSSRYSTVILEIYQRGVTLKKKGEAIILVWHSALT